jgi:hypothetical protein
MLIKPGELTSVVTKMFLEDNPAVPQSIWFINEDHFHLNGYVNKWNMHVWASEHPHNIMECGCGMLSTGIVRQTFFDDTVTADCYLHGLQEEFILFLKEMGSILQKYLFFLNRTQLGHTH